MKAKKTTHTAVSRVYFSHVVKFILIANYKPCAIGASDSSLAIVTNGVNINSTMA
jgi:hypothetical protein